MNWAKQSAVLVGLIARVSDMNLMKFLPVAQSLANLSKDPAVKVGAIIVDDDGNLLSSGWNGFPRGVIDSHHRLNSRELKLCFVVHAEANAIAQAARTGARVYGANIIVTERHPCRSCAGLIIQAGIRRVYAPVMGDDANQQWHDDRKFAQTMFNEAGVDVIEYER